MGGAGILLLAAVAFIALASGGSSKTPPAPAGKKCTKVEDLDEPLRSTVEDTLATEKNPAVLDKVAADLDTACPAVAQIVRDQAAVLRKSTGAGGGSGTSKPTTITFNAQNTPNPGAAHAAAVAIGSKTVAPGTPPSATANNGTYTTLQTFSQYDPAASAMLATLQAAAGITPDGKYGAQTLAAFNYWYWRTARPDGSTNVAGSTPDVSGTISGGVGGGGPIGGVGTV